MSLSPLPPGTYKLVGETDMYNNYSPRKSESVQGQCRWANSVTENRGGKEWLTGGYG